MEEMTFMVRKAIINDIPQILNVSKEAFSMYTEGAGIAVIVGPLQETYEDIERELEKKLIFVAVIDELVIGCVRVEVRPDNTAYLSRFGVLKEFQSKGIGKVLINTVDKAMMELKVKSLYLHTASRMFSLVRFYYGRGFYIESTCRLKGYIRALLCKEYPATAEVNDNSACKELVVV